MDRVGKIFGQKTVVQDVNGEIYFLRNALLNGEGKKLVFDLEEDSKNYVEILQIDVPLRPLFLQLRSKDCAIAVVRMAFVTITGEDLGSDRVKSVFEELKAYDPYLGADMDSLHKVLNRLFAQEGYLRNRADDRKQLSLKQLSGSVSPRCPAIAVLKNPGHVVVVDSITLGDDPEITVSYRDPDPGRGVQTYKKRKEGEHEGELSARLTGWFFTTR